MYTKHKEVIAMLNAADIKTLVEPIVKNTEVEKIVLFGSYAKGTASENSDIDLYMLSNGAITGLRFYELKSRFEEAFHTAVNLLPAVLRPCHLTRVYLYAASADGKIAVKKPLMYWQSPAVVVQ
ncbi:MAG: nucleotidyltransferase domain-containing protein [Clostridiales bacterium]|jgi:predicted nucleotidyltransferase|nr:nucleotidyltransferase domain-containing protein [Clostridiales bacterium]